MAEEWDFDGPIGRNGPYEQLYHYASDLKQMLEQQSIAAQKLEQSHHDTMMRLAAALAMSGVEEADEMYGVAVLSALMARELQMDDPFCNRIYAAALVRNIGLLGTPTLRCNRSSDELATAPLSYFDHPALGAALLHGGDSPCLKMAHDVAMAHHENYDGSGFPSGLSGEGIPLAARIVSAVQWTVQLIKRQSRLPVGYSLDDIVVRMREQAGRELDPVLVKVMAAHAQQFPRVLNILQERNERLALGFVGVGRGDWKEFLEG